MNVDRVRMGVSLFLVLLIGAVAGCGGGGGGGGGSSSASSDGQEYGSDGTPRYTISGTIILADTAAVDSDTNDANQPGWAGNDTSATAQSLSTPVQLAGYLNMEGKGVSGKTYTNGDLQDVYKVNLVAGQVVELSFASNTTDNDVDLALFDVSTGTAATAVGASSTGTSRECITITRDGAYYVVPWIVKGAAMYTLHIGAIGDAADCSNAMGSAQLFNTGRLVAREVETSVSGSAVSLAASNATQLNIPRLVSVPVSAQRMAARALVSLSLADRRDLDIGEAIDTLRYAKMLMATGAYAYVEPDFRLYPYSGFAPDDPDYASQLWHYSMINLPAAMEAINAMGVTNRKPIVAVIDYSFDINHPDLADRVVSPFRFAESGVVSGVSNTGATHGTFVSGLAVAAANNARFGIGVASMGLWMPVQMGSTASDSTTSSYYAAQAILYAAGLGNVSGVLPDRKADVINMSWGDGNACAAVFADAISRARANNVLIVASAGNTLTAGKLTPPIVANPANCPGAISVAALDADGNRAGYSGFGPNLTLTAPGGTAAKGVVSIGFSGSNYIIGSGYGTSFSAPQVAGVLALIRYVAPSITPEQVDTLIATGRITDDIGVAGRDDDHGYGLINASKAVAEAAALAAGNTISGAVVASPASISLGSTLDSVALTLSLTASSSDVVSSIAASSAAISVTANSGVSAATGLGSYTVKVDRSKLPVGATYATITVTSTGRTFTVPVRVIRLGITSSGVGNYGAILVRATNLATTTSSTQLVMPVNGRYTWTLSSLRGGTYALSASSDFDNDGNYCEAGEVCGDYPGNGQTLVVGSKLAGLDFSLAPLLGTGTQ